MISKFSAKQIMSDQFQSNESKILPKILLCWGKQQCGKKKIDMFKLVWSIISLYGYGFQLFLLDEVLENDIQNPATYSDGKLKNIMVKTIEPDQTKLQY